jgi:riboflavin transporter FmnP
MNSRTKHLTTLAMMAAMACLVMFIRIPVMPAAPFLTYDPKDAIIVMGGFMFGPMAALTLAAVAALVEMVTVSETGFWGFLMNFVSGAAFAVPASMVYKLRRTLPGAVIGLVAGVAVVVPVMLLMNYLIVPIFMPFVERPAVIPMLVPIFLPFNAIKYSLNAALALMVYKPVVTALTASGLYRPDFQGNKTRINWGLMIASAVIVLLLALLIVFLHLREVS